MTHRQAIKDWLAKINLKDQIIIDWGSGAKPVSRYINHENCIFITVDKNKLIAEDRRAATHLTHDITEPIKIDKADVAFCVEVLEHTLNPAAVLNNIYNNLRSSGTLYLTIPYNFRIHSDDDYLRLTPNGIRGLLTNAGFHITEFKYSWGDEGYLIKAVR